MTSDTAYASMRRAAGAERRAVLDVFTEAFMADPLTCWLFPEASERAGLQQHFYRPLLAHPGAAAYLICRSEGASLWVRLAAGQAPHGEDPDASEPGRDGVFGESGARLQALGAALAHHHPDREPHFYLACMGVVPSRRGSGLGSTMLRHGLERADAEHLGAYLEASSPGSRALYLRHGFADIGEPVRVADSPVLWPMWRQPSE